MRQNGAAAGRGKKEVSGMISFLLCLAILVGGYFVYGKIVDNTFGPDDRETPAVRINDGVDYVVMPLWKQDCELIICSLRIQRNLIGRQLI